VSRAVFAAALFVAACGSGQSALSPPDPAAPPAAGLAQKPLAPESEAPDEVVARALEIVTRLRELPAKGPVKGRTITRDAMIAHVKRQIRTEIPPAVVIGQQELLVALGTVDPKFDYEASLLALLTSELAGFYEPKDKTMYLAGDLGEVERGATLAHELVHALQDQHYDLARHVKYRDDATDEQSAVHALAEGDATSAMLDQILAQRGLRATDVSEELIGAEARGSMELAADAAGVPGIVKRSVVAPYVDGIVFVHWFRRRGGWAGVDSVWRNLPVSTEQILHPEKLVAGERPEVVPVPAPAKQGPATLLYRDVLGEQSVRLLFEEWMPRKSALTAASDWAGDRAAIYRDGGRIAVAWRVRFDHEPAARRGLEAFARGVLRQPGAAADLFVSAEEASKAIRGDRICQERDDRGPFAVVRKGRDLAVIAGPYLRSDAGVKSDGSCAAALAWGQTIVVQAS
jgi:hypothetical protein